MSKMPYDPYTMRIKEIPELIAELNKLIMPKQPGGRPLQTVWGVLCEASRTYAEASADMVEDGGSYRGFINAGRQQAASGVIRKIADGMGVDNFKLREVPLEQPVLPEVPVVPMPDGDPSGDGGDPSPATEAA